MGLYVRPLTTASGGLYVAPLTTDGMTPSLAPTITSVGTIREGATGVQIAGTNLTGASITLDSGAYSEAQANVTIAGDGNSGSFDVVLGELPWSSASHPVVLTVTTPEGTVEHAVTLLPPEGFGVAEMGADVGGSTDPWSVWYECLDGEPAAGAQVVFPLLSDAGGAVSMGSRGVISIDYSEVVGGDQLTEDQVNGLQSWSEGVRSAPVNKTITIDQAATAPVVTIDDYSGTDTTPALSGTIDDPNADISINIDGADYQGVNNADGTWSADVGPLGVGAHTATVTATDVDGLTGSDAGTVTILLLALTANNRITTDKTPALTGTVSDSDATVTVTINGSEYAATVSGNSWLADIADELSYGSYLVSVAAEVNGSAAETTASLTIYDPVDVVSAGGRIGFKRPIVRPIVRSIRERFVA